MSHEDAKTTKKSRVMRVGQASPRPPISQRTELESSKRMLMEEGMEDLDFLAGL